MCPIIFRRLPIFSAYPHHFPDRSQHLSASFKYVQTLPTPFPFWGKNWHWGRWTFLGKQIIHSLHLGILWSRIKNYPGILNCSRILSHGTSQSHPYNKTIFLPLRMFQKSQMFENCWRCSPERRPKALGIVGIFGFGLTGPSLQGP